MSSNVVHVDITAEGNIVIVGPGFQGRAIREGKRRLRIEETENGNLIGYEAYPKAAGARMARHYGLTDFTVKVDHES